MDCLVSCFFYFNETGVGKKFLFLLLYKKKKEWKIQWKKR